MDEGGGDRNQYLIPRTSHKFSFNYSSAIHRVSVCGSVGGCLHNKRSCTTNNITIIFIPGHLRHRYSSGRDRVVVVVGKINQKPLSNQHPLSFEMQMNVYNFFLSVPPPALPPTHRLHARESCQPQ